MSLSLYYSPGACSLAPHIILEELGVPYSLKLVSTDKGETRTAEFRKVNPKGRVPVLVHDDFVLTEAPAILLHLAVSHPESGLLSQSRNSLSRSLEWFNWLSGTVHAVAVRMIWRSTDFSGDSLVNDGIIARGKEYLVAAFLQIEEKMADRNYAVGTSYSVVDPYLLVFYRWGNRMGMDMKGDYPNWTKHTVRTLERPAVERAFSNEKISAWG